eukprot:756121-Hanusia_phi.AAC.2
MAQVAVRQHGDEDQTLDQFCSHHVKRRHNDVLAAACNKLVEENTPGGVRALDQAKDHEERGEEQASNAEEAGNGVAIHSDSCDLRDPSRDREVGEEIADDHRVDQTRGPSLEHDDEVGDPGGGLADGLGPAFADDKQSDEEEGGGQFCSHSRVALRSCHLTHFPDHRKAVARDGSKGEGDSQGQHQGLPLVGERGDTASQAKNARAHLGSAIRRRSEQEGRYNILDEVADASSHRSITGLPSHGQHAPRRLVASRAGSGLRLDKRKLLPPH